MYVNLLVNLHCCSSFPWPHMFLLYSCVKGALEVWSLWDEKDPRNAVAIARSFWSPIAFWITYTLFKNNQSNGMMRHKSQIVYWSTAKCDLGKQNWPSGLTFRLPLSWWQHLRSRDIHGYIKQTQNVNTLQCTAQCTAAVWPENAVVSSVQSIKCGQLCCVVNLICKYKYVINSFVSLNRINY